MDTIIKHFHPLTYLPKFILIISFYICLNIPSGCFPTKILYAFLVFPTLDICPAF